MNVETVPIDSIHIDPANANEHSEEDVVGLMAKLATFEQVEPLVVQTKTRKVIGGNGRLEAMRRLGWTEVDVHLVDVDNVTATAMGIALNTRKSHFIEDRLAEQLKALQSEDFDLAAVGYSGEELQGLIDGLATESLANGEATESREVPKVFSDEQIIEAAFQWFRKTGFPYRNLPIHVSMQELNKLARTDPESLLQTDTAYHVADTYNPHRYEAEVPPENSPFKSFYEDKQLIRVLGLEIEKGTIGVSYPGSLNVVAHTQACSNFRPGFACKLYRDYCQPGDTVLDTSTGYGGRLVGFMASGIAGLYIGIDPSTKTHAGNERMSQELGFADKVELWNLPAEDMQHAELEGRCDFAFTSPPYFSKEHYSEEPSQSWKRYPSGDSWREGFLLPMFELQFAALKPGKFSVVNIADVKIKGKVYPLASWAVTCAEQAGFTFIRTDEFPMQRRFGAGHDDEVATEPVLVFQKPGQAGSIPTLALSTASTR